MAENGDSSEPVHTSRCYRGIIGPYVDACLFVLVVTLLGSIFSSHFDLVNMALLYLLPVLLSAALWGSKPSFLASVLGVLAFDYFFIPPAFNFRPANARDFFVLGIFLIVAVVTGTMATRLRNELERTKAREKRTREAEEQLRHTSEQLRALSAHLQSIREDERTNLARDIHDELGQALTGLKMDLSRLSKKPPEDWRLFSEEIRGMGKLVDDIVRVVRKISTQLRPGVLDLGLLAAIEWQLGDFERRTGIESALSSTLVDTSLGADRSTALFRIMQEALTNIVRHAEASRVEVTVREDNGYITLAVADNGRGITDREVSDPHSLGLLGIRERALLLGGEAGISGKHGKGTTVTVTIPAE